MSSEPPADEPDCAGVLIFHGRALPGAGRTLRPCAGPGHRIGARRLGAMSPVPDRPHLPAAADVFAAAPEPHVVADARARIRAGNAAAARRIAVLDDDPTGSQTVHHVTVVTVLDPAEYAVGLAAPGSTCFVLTN